MRILPLIPCLVALAQAPDDDLQRDRIAALMRYAKARDRGGIARSIAYPLSRGYPVKPIQSPEECLERFDEIFDETLLSAIADSDLQQDWARVGWRGIIFKSGDLWLDEDYRIQNIVYETRAGKDLRRRVIAAQKAKLPPALRDFDEPELEWTTGKYLLRVDRKGEDYRLALLSRKDPTRVLKVLHHGVYQIDGQLGDFHIDWQVGGQTHRVNSQTPPGEDSYSVYDSLVDPNDWPEHPIEEQKRLK